MEKLPKILINTLIMCMVVLVVRVVRKKGVLKTKKVDPK